MLPARARPGRGAAPVPQGWLGVVADGPLTDARLRRAAPSGTGSPASGAEAVRTAFYWRDAPAHRPGRRRLRAPPTRSCSPPRSAGSRVLPVLQGTPAWAALNPGDPASPPRDPADFARLLTALVTRYGPSGSFWAEHPESPRQPIRDWQIWNEPNLTRYWNVAPWAPPVRRAAQGRPRRAEGGRPGVADDPRRAAERELARAARDLRRGRARRASTSSRCTRTPASRRT